MHVILMNMKIIGVISIRYPYECVTAENEPIAPIIFAREHFEQAKSARAVGEEGKDLPVAERAFLARGMYALAPSSDTWDVTRERINRLWSVQMQLPDLAALSLPFASTPSSSSPHEIGSNRKQSSRPDYGLVLASATPAR